MLLHNNAKIVSTENSSEAINKYPTSTKVYHTPLWEGKQC